MERETMNGLLGMTEEELDKVAAEYEDGRWDSSHLGEVTVNRERATA